MTIGKRAARLAASAAFAVLTAACSGGGGGSAPAVSVASAGSSGSTGTTNSSGSSAGSSSSSDPGSTGSTGSTSSTGSTGSTVPNVSIGSPDRNGPSASVTAQFNFTTSPPPVGTTFLLSGPAAAVTSTTVGPAGIQAPSARFTYEGTVTANGTTANAFDILIPQLNVNITNVPDDGSLIAINNNTAVFALQTLHMDYNLLGLWKYVPVQGASIYGINVNGSGTPQANIPTTGSATYTSGNPGVIGAYFIPSGTGTVTAGLLSGTTNITVNFGSGVVNGTLSNMQAHPIDGSAATPWNTLNLSGFLGGGNTAYTGPISVSAPPAGAGNAGFSTAAMGSFIGIFYGPNAQETAGTWTVTEPNAPGGGKTAYGGFGGAR